MVLVDAFFPKPWCLSTPKLPKTRCSWNLLPETLRLPNTKKQLFSTDRCWGSTSAYFHHILLFIPFIHIIYRKPNRKETVHLSRIYTFLAGVWPEGGLACEKNYVQGPMFDPPEWSEDLPGKYIHVHIRMCKFRYTRLFWTKRREFKQECVVSWTYKHDLHVFGRIQTLGTVSILKLGTEVFGAPAAPPTFRWALHPWAPVRSGVGQAPHQNRGSCPFTRLESWS